jgi:tetratricopeptide (TPR) repeat protein
MNVFQLLTGRFSNRGKAMSLYKRGMLKSKAHEHQGAIEDYTSAIGMQHAPPDVRAMALYNRALVYSAAGEDAKATADLNAVLAMTQDLLHVKTEARRKLVRMQRESDKALETWKPDNTNEQVPG